jgi:hypothetical protein
MVLKEHLDAMTVLFHQRDNPLRTFAITTHLRAFILEILNCARMADRSNVKKPMERACSYIHAHLTSPSL